MRAYACAFVAHIRDYYKLGENVWGIDEEGKPTRLQLLNMILAAYNDWINCEDRYWGWDETDTTDTFMFTKKNPTTKQIETHIMKLKNLKYEDDKKNLEAFQKEYTYCKKHFFELLGEHIEELWD